MLFFGRASSMNGQVISRLSVAWSTLTVSSAVDVSDIAPRVAQAGSYPDGSVCAPLGAHVVKRRLVVVAVMLMLLRRQANDVGRNSMGCSFLRRRRTIR
jgi:hypothetical protein